MRQNYLARGALACSRFESLLPNCSAQKNCALVLSSVSSTILGVVPGGCGQPPAAAQARRSVLCMDMHFACAQGVAADDVVSLTTDASIAGKRGAELLRWAAPLTRCINEALAEAWQGPGSPQLRRVPATGVHPPAQQVPLLLRLLQWGRLMLCLWK